MFDDDDPFSLEVFSVAPKSVAVDTKKAPSPVFKAPIISLNDDFDPFSVDLQPVAHVQATPVQAVEKKQIQEIYIHSIKDYRVDPAGKIEFHVEWRLPTGFVSTWESRDVLFSNFPEKQLERFLPPKTASVEHKEINNTIPNITYSTDSNLLPDRPKTPERQHDSWPGILEKGGQQKCSLSLRWLKPISTTIIKTINVTRRCEWSVAVKHTLKGVLEMVPSSPNETVNFKKFMEYLRQKDRVGVATWEDLIVHVCLPDNQTIQFLHQHMVDVPHSQKFENYVLYGLVSKKR